MEHRGVRPDRVAAQPAAGTAGRLDDLVHPLVAEDIADILVWVATRPPHVNIDEMLIKPVDQAAMHKVYRRKPSA